MEIDIGAVLFVVGGVIGIYLLKLLIQVLNKFNELIDKISTLIMITYESIHNPNITTKIDIKGKK